MTYHIVLFITENVVEAVPSHWLSRDGKTCAWPKKHLDATRQIEKKNQPNTLEYTWVEVRVLSNSICKYRFIIVKSYTINTNYINICLLYSYYLKII